MKTNKNIDRLFQEKLKDFEVFPPDNVWNGIEDNLKTNKSKRLFPLWFRIGSAAAILIFLTIGGVNYFSSEPSDINNDNTIVTDSDSESTPKINEEILKKDILNSTEKGNIITEVENNDNKNDVISKIKSFDKEQLTNKERTNSKNNIQNTVAAVQSKNNLGEPNAGIVTGSNSLRQDMPLSNKSIAKDTNDSNIVITTGIVNSKNNIQNTVINLQSKGNLDKSNTKIATNDNSFKENVLLSNKKNMEDVNDNNIAATTNNVNSKKNSINNNGDSTSSDNIAQNNAKESVNKNLTEPKDKLFDTQINFDKTNEDENTVTQVEMEKIESLEDTLNKNIEEETEENTKKWSVASMFAPVFYNSFNAKGSPLDLQFENSPKQGSKTMSYGVKVGYKINSKLSLQSGVSLVNVGYKIGDVFINPSQQGLQRLTNVNYSNAASILNVQAGDILNNVQLETASSVPIKGSLNQEFGYIEVPLELKYKLNNSQKVGINLIGGFSTLFLNKNEVYVETSEFSSNLGEANNLNSVNFSGNLGIDIDYKINKNLYLNVAPMLKIHTSTFSKNADNFKPYILGVYTGLNYKF